MSGEKAPAPTGEAADWANLAAEIDADPDFAEIDGGEGEPRQPAGTDQAAPEAKKGEGEGEEQPKAPPIPYEELERRYRQQGGALKEAREAQRQAAQQMQAFTDMVADLRAQRQAQRQPEPKQPQPEDIDPYENPIGWMQQQIAGLRNELAATGKTATEVKEADQRRSEYQQFMGVVERAETAFAAITPDYHQAVEHLEKARRSELAVLYPDDPRMDAYARQHGYRSAAHLREAAFQNDAQSVARSALSAGINPAEAYYNLAKARGYVKSAAPAGNGRQNGSLVDQAIDAARRGQKATKTIGGGSGKQDSQLSVQDLTDLYAEDPEAFDREWDRMAKAGRLG